MTNVGVGAVVLICAIAAGIGYIWGTMREQFNQGHYENQRRRGPNCNGNGNRGGTRNGNRGGTRNRSRGSGRENKTCCICREDMDAYTFPCGHSVHISCARQMQSLSPGAVPRCPLCRSEFDWRGWN